MDEEVYDVSGVLGDPTGRLALGVMMDNIQVFGGEPAREALEGMPRFEAERLAREAAAEAELEMRDFGADPSALTAYEFDTMFSGCIGEFGAAHASAAGDRFLFELHDSMSASRWDARAAGLTEQALGLSVAALGEATRPALFEAALDRAALMGGCMDAETLDCAKAHIRELYRTRQGRGYVYARLDFDPENGVQLLDEEAYERYCRLEREGGEPGEGLWEEACEEARGARDADWGER
ncbi:MAG: hypothetical protein MR874_11140 [Coriobacteriaceae bacterium]|nr:hypothetical protein [Coriobacteriaceae bacterium]MCI6845291.1 hypothetical protein [Coriobacteriaceae bacterium]